MASFYDDERYGVIERVWLGLPKTWGGGAAAGITFNETQSTPIKRFYPRGPVQVLKLGVQTLATLGKGEQLFNLTVDGTSSVFATIVASTTSAPGTIASKAVNASFSAGSYFALQASTNVCSTGTVAVFIDYRRLYKTSGAKWDPSS